MTKLSSVLLGVFLTISVLVAATVVGQTFSDPSRSSAAPAEKQAPDRAPAPGAGSVFEYEIRVWKDGAAITPTMKLRAHPGETSQLKIPEGTVDLSFRPDGTGIDSGVAFARPAPTAAAGPPPKTAPNSSLSQARTVDPAQQREAVDRLTRALAAERAKADVSAAKLLSEIANADGKNDLRAAEQAFLGLKLSRAAGENKDYEKRLADIEKKLERILSVIDRVPPSPAMKHAPQQK